MSIEVRITNLIEESLINYIADKVVEKLTQKYKQVLVVFTGTDFGFYESIGSLKKLRDEGWTLDVIISESAKGLLDIDYIKKELKVVDLIITDEISKKDRLIYIKKIIDRNYFVIVPTLTINTASKITRCISDTFTTSVISEAISIGKVIIASIDGFCPDNIERKKREKSNFNEAYKITLRHNIDTLRSFGISLTTSVNLYKKVKRALSKELGLKLSTNNSVRLNKNIISRRDIYNNRSFDTIIVGKNCMITDLAVDETRKLKIKLLKE